MPLEIKPRTAREVTGQGEPLRDIVLPKGERGQVANCTEQISEGQGKANRGSRAGKRPSFWGERASGTGGAVEADCAERCKTRRGGWSERVHGGARSIGASVAVHCIS